MLYIRGDTHRQFAGIRVFCAWKKTSKADILIITGDVGINGRNSRQDRILKKELQELPITLFCLRGNHDRRPSSLGSYRESILYGGVVYREEEFPDLLFARSGESYSMNGRQIFVIGGGVSKAGDILFKYIEPSYKRCAFGPCKQAKFALAKLGNDAGIYGAAALVLK